MKDTLLQATTDTISSASALTAETTNNCETLTFSIWFWVSIAEFVIIVFILLRLKRKNNDLKFGDLSKDKLKNAKKSDIDMDNLMNSINGSKELYKELSRICHPDRFINSEKHQLAEEIFQEISKHKRNFNKLTELKKRAISELQIDFNK